jgi:hypothetical protein
MIYLKIQVDNQLKYYRNSQVHYARTDYHDASCEMENYPEADLMILLE